MQLENVSAISPFKRTIFVTAGISIIWVFGLLVGCYFAECSSDTFSALIHTTASSRPSILGSFIALFIPFVLSAVLIKFSQSALSALLLFVKAVLFGFCGCGTMTAFSSAGWLVRPLLLFSDSCIIVLLLWLLVRNATADKRSVYTDIFLCAVLTFLICFIDYFAVSPFLMLLI